jgi:hypothetical protein
MGFGVVSARWNNRTAQIGTMMLAAINTQPTARATNTSPLPVGTGRTGQYQCNRNATPIPAAYNTGGNTRTPELSTVEF